MTVLDANELKVFSGNAHPQLAKDVCEYLGIPLGDSETFKFANDNTFVRIRENIRERDVFIVQPTVAPTNDNLNGASDYDRRLQAGVGWTHHRRHTLLRIRAHRQKGPAPGAYHRPAGGPTSSPPPAPTACSRWTLHAGQIQGFFNIPVDELTAEPILSNYFFQKGLEDLALVAVDFGISKRARDMAERLGVPVAVIEKRRTGNDDKSETLNVIGDVRGKRAPHL